ncbi:hypothetical protein TRM7615_02456 [Falsiruegeria mediterranea M17]|uniref:Uncharacterized protein n=1 Tax=Falsiruegeria mediterranea M17 TaxID=1200281 RepID=A0A2R8C9B7_9RHOB|nr:hypothetical protein TRM7615_02456 [Falsiruegeria mediterranea M17]
MKSRLNLMTHGEHFGPAVPKVSVVLVECVG